MSLPLPPLPQLKKKMMTKKIEIQTLTLRIILLLLLDISLNPPLSNQEIMNNKEHYLKEMEELLDLSHSWKQYMILLHRWVRQKKRIQIVSLKIIIIDALLILLRIIYSFKKDNNHILHNKIHLISMNSINSIFFKTPLLKG